MTQTPPVPQAVERSLSCRRCGYELRGLAREGTCPECGAPVADALSGGILHLAAPEYLRWINRGAALVFWIGIAFSLYFAAEIAIIVCRDLNYSVSRGTEMTVAGAGALGGLLNALGWWWVSEPDPAFIGRDPSERVRKFARVTFLILMATEIAGLALTALGPSLPAVVTTINDILNFAVAIVSYFPSVLYLRVLARRVPDEALARFCGTLLWLGPLLMTVGCAVFGLGPIAAMVLMLVVQWRIWRRIREALSRAEQAEHRPNMPSGTPPA